MEVTCFACHHSVPVPADVTDGQVRCPNCGASVSVAASDGEPVPYAAPVALAVPHPHSAAASVPGEGLAIASLVCALLFFVPLVTQVLAVCLGAVALVRMGRSGGRRGLAIVGVALGLLIGAGWGTLLSGIWAWQPGTGVATSYIGTGYYGSPDQPLEAQRSELINAGLERISHGLSAYRRDMGRWPEDLSELVPTYLSQALLARVDPDGAPGPNRLILLVADVDPRADRPERIVAYSVPVTCDQTGERFGNARRWVLLLSGQIEARDAVAVEAELGRSLE